jgi:GxxExxY protein
MDYTKYRDLVYKIIGAAMEVHGELGYGLLEPVYQEALSRELSIRHIDNVREKEIEIYYKGVKMDKFYKMDLVVDDIIVELKAVESVASEHRAQLFNYLRLTQKPIGVLINFGEKNLHSERYIYDKDTNECYLVDKNLDPVE